MDVKAPEALKGLPITYTPEYWYYSQETIVTLIVLDVLIPLILFALFRYQAKNLFEN